MLPFLPMTTTTTPTHPDNTALDLSRRGHVVLVEAVGTDVQVGTVVSTLDNESVSAVSTIKCSDHDTAKAVASLWRAVFCLPSEV